MQQLPMGLNDDDDDGNLEIAESSDDERAGYPTLPVEGISTRPSVNSLRHVSYSLILFRNILYKLIIAIHEHSKNHPFQVKYENIFLKKNNI